MRLVARHAPAAVRDRGADLVLSALPHRAAAEGRAARVPRPVVLAARRRASASPSCASATATTPRSSCTRCRASAAATSPRRWRSTSAPRRRRTRRAGRGRARGRATPAGDRRARSAAANDPYEPGRTRYRRAARGARRRASTAEQIVAALKDSGLRGMGGAGFPTGKKWELVAEQEADARSTRSATPTSPSPARSRTARSWPSSRTWCSRACCSAWS